MFAKIEKWANKNGIIFNPETFEVIQFFNKKVFLYPNIKILLFIFARHNILKQVIKLIEKKILMYWLKIFYNSRFFSKDHANKLASKREQTILGFKMPVKITQEINATIMHRTVYICIFLS